MSRKGNVGRELGITVPNPLHICLPIASVFLTFVLDFRSASFVH